jgi:sugar lactone lactonase YvrE
MSDRFPDRQRHRDGRFQSGTCDGVRDRDRRIEMRIEVLIDVKTTLGEGPLWDVDQERLYWIDSFDGRVFRATADGREIRCWDLPQKIGSMAIRNEAPARSFRWRAASIFSISRQERLSSSSPRNPASRATG